jgi:uncharacterized membrane protein/mono/diheme cytochrome c family protein
MKKWWLSVVISVALFAGLPPAATWAQPNAPVRMFEDEVRGVFASRCTVCHGPDLVKPKGRFGYVLDLQRVAGNPEMVIPHRPDESELWVLVQRNEMPPSDSPSGSLTIEQKEIIRAWIAAGAPYAAGVTADSIPIAESKLMTIAQENRATADRIVNWLGKFHLLLLHFPIALVFVAGMGEALSIWRRHPRPSESVRFCLWIGAMAALPTAGLGWLYAAAGNGVGSPQLLMAHRYLGTITAVWLVVTAICAEMDSRRGVRSRSVWFLLASGVFLTAITAHLGGLLDHGADFFTY